MKGQPLSSLKLPSNRMTDEGKNMRNWVLRLMGHIHKQIGIHPFIISIVIYGIFPYSMLSFLHHGLVDNIGLICAFIWMGLAPYIILQGESLIDRLPIQLLPLVRDCKEEFNDLYFNFIKSIYGIRHLIFGVPLAIVGDIICYYSFRSSFNVLALSFLLMIIFVLFILVSIGFWYVKDNIIFIYRACRLPLHINPLHHDKFGGMKFMASYCVRTALLLSIGLLIYPLGFETFKRLTVPCIYTAYYTAVSITIFSTLVIIASFSIPLYLLHIKARNEKTKILEAGEWSIIDEVLPIYLCEEGLDPNQIFPIFIRYMIEEKIKEMTTIPIDVKLLVEIGIILIEPIVIIKGIFELIELFP